MKRSILALIFSAAYAQAAAPFVMFPVDAAYKDTGTIPLTAKYISSGDFVGIDAALAVPALQKLVPPDHLMVLAPRLQDVQARASASCLEGPGLIVYQQGRGSEMANPIANLNTAAAAVKASGCRKFGFLPGGVFFGFTQCAVNLAASYYQQADWTKVDYLIISGGGLVNDFCAGKTGAADYAAAAKTIAAYAREKNPEIVIVGHLSFRNAPAANMAQAASALTGIVDGFLLGYPIYGEHHYCDSADLQAFLSAIRP
jgi:hypothetical protein